MNNEEKDKIRKILSDAAEQIITVLDDKTFDLKEITQTANKIMHDAFDAKTFMVDENKIDKVRYGMLDYIPNIESLYQSCKYWATTGELNINSEYKRFCENMAKLSGTTLEDELNNNIDIIVLKHKLNGSDTGSSNGEITT